MCRKQRLNERAEVARARSAMARCISEGHFDEAYAASRLAIEVGEKIREAREAAGLSQRELARGMGTSQAAVARLEAGGVGATPTTLQRVAAALELEIAIELRPTA